jgi:hypothetical protein
MKTEKKITGERKTIKKTRTGAMGRDEGFRPRKSMQGGVCRRL